MLFRCHTQQVEISTPLAPSTVLGGKELVCGSLEFSGRPRWQAGSRALAPSSPPAPGATLSSLSLFSHLWFTCLMETAVAVGDVSSGHTATWFSGSGTRTFLLDPLSFPALLHTQPTASVLCDLSPHCHFHLGDSAGLGAPSLPAALRGLFGLLRGSAMLSYRFCVAQVIYFIL